MLLRTSRPDANNKTCIEYVGLRAKALPLHRPMEFQQEWRNLSTNATGQLISECNFGVFKIQISQKANQILDRFPPYRTGVCQNLVGFLGDLKTPKFHSEIN